MPSGHGEKKKGTLFLLVEFNGGPLPKKKKNKGHHWAVVKPQEPDG